MLKILGGTEAAGLGFENYKDLMDFLVAYNESPEDRLLRCSGRSVTVWHFERLPVEDREAIWRRFQEFHEKHPHFSYAMRRLTGHCEVSLQVETREFPVDALLARFGEDKYFRACVDAWRFIAP